MFKMVKLTVPTPSMTADDNFWSEFMGDHVSCKICNHIQIYMRNTNGPLQISRVVPLNWLLSLSLGGSG